MHIVPHRLHVYRPRLHRPNVRRSLGRLLAAPHLIRFRLTLWYTVLAAVVLAGFVGGVFYFFSHSQLDSWDNQTTHTLTQALSQQVRLQFNPACNYAHHFIIDGNPTACFVPVLKDPTALNYGDVHVLVTDANGNPLPLQQPDSDNSSSTAGQRQASQQPASLFNNHAATSARKTAAKASGSGPAPIDNGPYRYITISWTSPTGERLVGQIVAPLTHAQDQVDALKHILIYAAGVMLLISAAGGWLLAGRALKPIDELTRRARQISAHDLSQRLNLDQEDELGRMAATFDDMIGRLQEAFERQKRFTSDASHELRTPLTVMQAELGLALTRPRAAEDYRHTLLSMDEEVSRLSLIVNDLLTLTRIDVDPVAIQHQPVVLNELLGGLARRVGMIAAERDIVVEVEGLQLATITGDATRLRQLFTNLLDNAVTYTPDGGRVTVRLESARDGARVTIGDTGIGIAAEHLPRIFERFYRTSEARAHHAHGTGLGLAISWSVVQAHQGEISVRSTPGQGTTFTVFLPTDGEGGRPRSPSNPLIDAFPPVVVSNSHLSPTFPHHPDRPAAPSFPSSPIRSGAKCENP